MQTAAIATNRTDPKTELLTWIEQARNLTARLGPDFVECHDQLSELQTRLSQEKFHMAVLGQFKRGKSTLVNALLGVELLPIRWRSIANWPRSCGSSLKQQTERSKQQYREISRGNPKKLSDRLCPVFSERSVSGLSRNGSCAGHLFPLV
jgi:predicted GTPase